MRTASRSRHNAVIVGARAAGASTAMLLARLGHDVMVVDQASFPSNTVSAHAIARSGVVQLQRWGLLDAVLDSGAPAVRQVTFHVGGESVSPAIKHKAGVDLVVAPRRYVLDTILAAAAQRAGADVRPGVTVTGVQRDSRGRVTGICGHDRAGAPIDLRGSYVIGADGLRSRVARSAGAAISQGRPAGGAAQYAYYEGIRWAGMELSVAERSFAGVFPTHHGQACIWVCTPSADARAARRRAGSREEAFGELLERSCPAAGRSAAPRPPDLTGAGHAPPAQSGAPVVRPGPGAGRRCRLSPGRDHRLRHQRDHALREIFEITCRLAAYPAMPAFIELQKQLSAAIDTEAVALAARPIPGECLLATA